MNPHGCENGVPSASSFPHLYFPTFPEITRPLQWGRIVYTWLVGLVGYSGECPLGLPRPLFQPGALTPSTLISIKRKWWGKLLFLHRQCTYMGNQDPKGRNCLKSQVSVAEWGEFMSPDIIYIYRSDSSICNELVKNMVGK